jgi:hypothetical protein
VASLLLSASVGLAVLGLVFGVVHRVDPSNPLESIGPILLAAGAAMFGLSFLIRAAARPPGAERNRYVGVGIVGVVGAVAIWARDVWHLGPPGSWLLLIVVVLAGVAAILLYWEDLRRTT